MTTTTKNDVTIIQTELIDRGRIYIVEGLDHVDNADAWTRFRRSSGLVQSVVRRLMSDGYKTIQIRRAA